MNSTPVSVCIPTYNGEDFLEETIESVLSQTLKPDEIIVCDDSSRDRTVDIAQTYAIQDPRVRVLTHQTNVGAVANWNRAITAVQSPLVKLLHQDDLLHPDCLEAQVSAYEKYSSDGSEVAIVAAQRRVIDPHGKVLVRRRGLGGLDGLVDRTEVVSGVLRRGTNIVGEPSAVLLVREALDAAGGFGRGWQYLVDLDCWIRLLAHGRLVAIPRPLVDFRITPGSWSSELASQQSQEAIRFLDHLARSYPEVASVWDRARGVLMARGTAWSRRFLYFLLGTREKLGWTSARDGTSAGK